MHQVAAQIMEASGIEEEEIRLQEEEEQRQKRVQGASVYLFTDVYDTSILFVPRTVLNLSPRATEVVVTTDTSSPVG